VSTPSPSKYFTYIATSITWGCSFIFIKLSLGFLTPFGVAFGRCLFGAATLLLIAKVRSIALPKFGVIWGRLLLVALCINVLPGIFFALAETRTTTILASIINALVPLTSLFFITVVFRDERITRQQALGLAVGFGGVLVAFGVWQGMGSNPWWAVGALLAAVTLYGVTFPYIRRHITPLGINPVALSATQLLISVVVLTPTFLFDGLNGHEVTLRAGFAIVVLGTFSSGLAFMWNFRTIQLLGPSTASTVTYWSPLVATIVGIVFLHERLFWFQPVGAAIVLLGSAISQNRLHWPARSR
jgi:hypothetical protein